MLMYWLQSDEVPADEAIVRSTRGDYNRDTPAAEAKIPQTDMPNTLQTDANPNIDGIHTTQVAGTYEPREKYAPSWADEASAQYNESVNRQVASSGTAAAREKNGEFGHGTMASSVAIDPAYHENSAFGNDYFAAERRGANSVDDVNMMTVAPGYDVDSRMKDNATGKNDIRDASVNTEYGAWFAQLAMGN